MEPEPEPEPEQQAAPAMSTLSGLPPVPDGWFGRRADPDPGSAGVGLEAAAAGGVGGGDSEAERERERQAAELAHRTPEFLGEHTLQSDAVDPTRVGHLLLQVEGDCQETGLGQAVLRVWHKPPVSRRRRAPAAGAGTAIIIPVVTGVGRAAADTHALRHIAGHRVRVLATAQRRGDPTTVTIGSGSAPLSRPQGEHDKGEQVDVTVAVDQPPPLLGEPVRPPQLAVEGRAKTVWLSTMAPGSGCWACGPDDDGLELTLDCTPLRPSEAASTGGAEAWLWRTELSCLRCGTHEAHRALPTTPGEHATIGDYTLTIEERVTPLCQEVDGLLLSEYPMLICHVRLSVRRVETSVGDAEERMWEELLG